MPSPGPSPAPTSEPEQDMDLASTMGFASFGAKPNPPKKKRKFDNSGIDIEGSGSNNTPLGTRGRKTGGLASGQSREQEDGEMQGNRCLVERKGDAKTWEEGDVTGQSVQSEIGAWGENEDEGGTGRETSEFVDQRRAYVVGGEEVRTVYRDEERFMAPAMHSEHLEGSPKAVTGAEPGKRENGEWDWQALRRGIRNEKGDMAFYDASFVEDPWRGLLRAKG